MMSIRGIVWLGMVSASLAFWTFLAVALALAS